MEGNELCSAQEQAEGFVQQGGIDLIAHIAHDHKVRLLVGDLQPGEIAVGVLCQEKEHPGLPPPAQIPGRRYRGAENLVLAYLEAEADQLAPQRGPAAHGGIGGETEGITFLPQVGDGLGRAGDGLVVVVQHAVQVNEKGAAVSPAIHWIPLAQSRRCSALRLLIWREIRERRCKALWPADSS